MARQFAIGFGAVYVLIGIVGLILPSPLLGIFGVNLLRDIVHLWIGGLWLVAAFAAPMARTPRKASQLIGIVYFPVAILGFVVPDLMNQRMVINIADSLLHLGTEILALYIGFMSPRPTAIAAGSVPPPRRRRPWQLPWAFFVARSFSSRRNPIPSHG